MVLPVTTFNLILARLINWQASNFDRLVRPILMF